MSTQFVFALFLLTTLLYVESKNTNNEERRPYSGNDSHLFSRKGIYNNMVVDDPPPPAEAARMARYIVHNADWASVGTISSMMKIKTFPFANIFSVSDGLMNNSSSTGIPYLYMTPIDMTAQDLSRDSRSSLVMTLAQGDYCKHQNLDPEDPRCAHVTLTGRIRKLENGSSECDFAREALFTRHPVMRKWPMDHHWYFAKLNIEQVCVMDYFGGPKFVPVKDYFMASPAAKPSISVLVV